MKIPEPKEHSQLRLLLLQRRPEDSAETQPLFYKNTRSKWMPDDFLHSVTLAVRARDSATFPLYAEVTVCGDGAGRRGAGGGPGDF